ncbi:LytR family transcriptional regulator [Tissierella creatinini]|nr:LytR family transcriptional regulator [Tissierella creatinini]TJX63600.1 LytR family transcriptional regulator [Soehngenia saccharolytica]
MLRRFFRVFFSFFIIFSLVFFGANFYSQKVKGDLDEAPIVDKGTKSDSINFLLMGVDSKDVEDSIGTRTDTLMVFNVDKSSGEISILSIPRDTRVKIEGRKYKEKINHAHAYGGPELTLETVSNLLNLDLEYYVIADYNFARRFVDLIGGVEIDVPMDMYYEDPTAEPPLLIDLKAGNQILDGDESLQYLRFRKGYKNADLGRIEAQQGFMKSMVNRTLRPINIIKVPQMYAAYNDYITTNIPLSTIAKFGLSALKYDLDTMNTVTLPGESKMVSGLSYYVHYEEETQKLVSEMFNINNQTAVTMNK